MALDRNEANYRWYLFVTRNYRVTAAAQLTGATDCLVWTKRDRQWKRKPWMAERVAFSDTGWEESSKAAVDEFISRKPTFMPYWHSPEAAQLNYLRMLVDWAELPEEPDGEEMHTMLLLAVQRISDLRVKLDTGDLIHPSDGTMATQCSQDL